MVKGSASISTGAMAVLAAGAVLTYAAVTGKGIGPAVRALMSGRSPADVPTDTPIRAVGGTGQQAEVVPVLSGSVGTSGRDTATRSRNLAVARLLAAPYGWATGRQWDALVQVGDIESEWDENAVNPSSHAGGIPQANPYTKMPRAAWPRSLGGSASVPLQIAWMLQYIKGTYGDPETALAHEHSHGWY